MALVRAASILLVLLFALSAGPLADAVDRRHPLLEVNASLAATAAVLAAAMAMTPLLLLSTFVSGAAPAFIAPAWQAVVRDSSLRATILTRGRWLAGVVLTKRGWTRSPSWHLQAPHQRTFGLERRLSKADTARFFLRDRHPPRSARSGTGRFE